MADTYTVKKGDTLSEIADKYNETYGYSSYQTYMNYLVEINNIKNPNYITVGQVIKLKGTASTQTNTSSTVKMSAPGIVSNTDRQAYVEWVWTKSNTDHYVVYWEYQTSTTSKLGVTSTKWLKGEESEVTTKYDTYTAPSEAKKVRVKVKAVAKTRKVNGKDTPYWTTTSYCTAQTYDFSDNPPSTPPVPTVTIEGVKLTASLSNIGDLNADSIEFQIVKDDKTVVATKKVSISTTSCKMTYTVSAGSVYKVRARGCRTESGKTLTGAWSNYSSNTATAPKKTTKFTAYVGDAITTINVEWDAIADADSYELWYTHNLDFSDYDDTGTNTVKKTGIQETGAIITGLHKNYTYRFKVRGVNQQGDGVWSDEVVVKTGGDTTAPTTWSTATVIVSGEDTNLYWKHNSEDSSKWIYAEVELIVDGERQTHVVTNPTFNGGEIRNVDNVDGVFALTSDVYGSAREVKWRVRIDVSKGSIRSYGAWSVSRTVDISVPAYMEMSVTDNSGASLDTLESFPFYISASVGPEDQTVLSYNISIVANETYETVDSVGNNTVVLAGQTVYSANYDVGGDLLVEMSAGNVTLENNISYTLTCTAAMDTGLTTESSKDFTVGWSNETYWPNATVVIDTDVFSAAINPYCDDEEGNLIEDVLLSVYRRELDGTFTEIAVDIENDGSTFVIDPHPALDYARYRIVAKTKDTGAVSYYDLPDHPVGGSAIIIQWDEAWSSFTNFEDAEPSDSHWSGSMLKLPFNIEVSNTSKPEVSLMEYAGRKHPVTYYGTQLGTTGTWSTVIDKKDKQTVYGLQRLAIWPGDVYVREPSGTGFWANVHVTFPQKYKDLTIPITFDITRVEGGV